MAVQQRTACHDVDGVFWLGLPVGSMMDNTDIKAGEAKLGELKGNMDAINAARRKGGCVAGTLQAAPTLRLSACFPPSRLRSGRFID
ncbi:hypothetical protein [Mesorhizobium sp. M0909]|uniref:hypothetical protein n=2 Tax=unclassified Mesorhizobium TaxID=325217 RepID=UPI00333A7FC2